MRRDQRDAAGDQFDMAADCVVHRRATAAIANWGDCHAGSPAEQQHGYMGERVGDHSKTEAVRMGAGGGALSIVRDLIRHRAIVALACRRLPPCQSW
jgi:hypothetical protein